MQVDCAAEVGDARTAVGRDATERGHACRQRRRRLGQHGPARAGERNHHCGLAAARAIAEPERMIDLLERSAAPLGEGQRGVEERQCEAADRDRCAGRDRRELARSNGKTECPWPTARSTSSRRGPFRPRARSSRLRRAPPPRPPAEAGAHRRSAGRAGAPLRSPRSDSARPRRGVGRHPRRGRAPGQERLSLPLGTARLDGHHMSSCPAASSSAGSRAAPGRRRGLHPGFGCGSNRSTATRASGSRRQAWSSSRSSANSPFGPRPISATRSDGSASGARGLGKGGQRCEDLRQGRQAAASQPSSRSTQSSS